MNHLNRFLWVIVSCLLAGCQSEQRESLHEMDHFVPAHWPSDLSDAASKIDERLAILVSNESDAVGSADTAGSAAASKELFDIVGWMPEVAADTFLKEAEWMPVYEASLELSKTLQRSKAKLDPAAADQVRRFSDLLRKQAEIESLNAPQKIDNAEGAVDGANEEILEPEAAPETTKASE